MRTLLDTIILMHKWRGFTIIEILTTITILAIVATIAAPEFWRIKNRDDYRNEGQALFDTLLDARNSALTNKFCSDGSISTRWMVFIDSNAEPVRYRLRCYSDETTFIDETELTRLTKSELETVEFNELNPPAVMDGGVGALFPDNIRFSFFSGGANGRLEYSSGGIFKAESIQMVIGHDTTDYQHTICFNRVSGFPTFNKTGDTCQEY